jgi:hypothetical protein
MTTTKIQTLRGSVFGSASDSEKYFAHISIEAGIDGLESLEAAQEKRIELEAALMKTVADASTRNDVSRQPIAN